MSRPAPKHSFAGAQARCAEVRVKMTDEELATLDRLAALNDESRAGMIRTLVAYAARTL